MTNTIVSIASIAIVVTTAFLLSSRFKLSSKYERKPEKLTDWNRQDLGEDPSKDGKSR
jgi:hypothetical protein